MSWTYRYRGIDDAGLDDKWDKVKGPPAPQKHREWTVEEIARIRDSAKKQSKIPVVKEVDDIPVRGRWDYTGGIRYYLDNVIDYGVVGRRCYLTVRVMGSVHNVHVPDTDSWEWLKTAIKKNEGSGSK